MVSDLGPEGADVARTGDTSHPDRPENRGINRIPVRLAVSHKGRSAPLGRTRDLSLHGVFIETREPFDVGAILPLAIETDPRAPLSVRAEVVRRTGDGMGLRFHDLDKETSRRLRRWVVEQTSVVGSRRQVEQLIEGSAHIEPIRSAERIRQLLRQIAEGHAKLTLIPVERIVRDQARLVELEHDALVFETEHASTLTRDEEVYALLTLSFVSYSFGAHVLAVEGRVVRCSVPEMIVFSERRTKLRTPAPSGSRLLVPSPTGDDGALEFPLVDISDDGLAFRAPENALLMTGTPLIDASLLVDGRIRTIGLAQVRNIRRVEDTTGTWLRVGVAFGAPRSAPSSGAIVGERRRHGAWARMVERMRATLSVLVHRGRHKLGASSDEARLVTVRNGLLPIVGLLDMTSAEPGVRLRAPLVIVVPGFAGRKEQMGFFAGVMVEGFRRQHGDIAVLRIDGTNNLGQSGKAPGMAADGMHAIRYTVSGAADDIVAALAWAKNNPYVDPTRIVLLSSSMGSIPARHVLAGPHGRDVSLWVSYMGSPDAIDSIRNVSGNIDLYAYWRLNKRLGVVSLNGVLCDGDHFWADLHRLEAADLGQACAEMARIHADVIWFRGRFDAFMDPRRVDAVMGVPSPGLREIVDVESGHLPRTGTEAIRQFVRIAQRIWQAVHMSVMPDFTPSLGKLALKSAAEWQAVRRAAITDRTSWWRNYLIEGDGFGFDILEYAPEYADFMDLQAQRLLEGGTREPYILELGAGTGNLCRRLVERGARVHAVDLVPEALARLESKLGAAHEGCTTQVLDLEGSPLLAFRRYAAGDLAGPRALMERVPGIQPNTLEELLAHDGDDLQAVFKGRGVNVAALARRYRLSPQANALLVDWHLCARAAVGSISIEEAQRQLTHLAPAVLDGPRGLPLPDGSVDGIALSLVLSYLNHPDDVLFEARRVLVPGGRLIVSSMMRDAESSQLYLGVIGRLEGMPDEDLPPGPDPTAMRSRLLASARRFVDHGAELFRLEEEGLFRFYDADELEQALARRGFEALHTERALGSPGQAVIVTCRK